MKIPIIKTKKFILRPLKETDALAVFKNINNKKIIFNLASVPWPLTLKNEKDWLKKTVREYGKKKTENIVWAIDINGEAVGGIGFHHLKEKHKAEIGYWLAEKCWGKGIMTEATKLITKFGFDKLKLQRIGGEVFIFNKGSKRVLEKAGYKQEGILKKYVRAHGRIIDAYILAKIKK